MVIPCLFFFHLNKEVLIIKKCIVPNTNNRYYATEDGHIFDTKFNRFVSENINKRGWVRCHLWFNNKRITIGVHRVIMYAFVGISNLTVNHKDGDKTNNNISNLEYMSREQQNQHRSYVLKRGNRRKIRCLDNNKVYETIKDACDDLGIKYANSHISEVCKKKYGFKSSQGYHFEYIDK